MTSTPARSLRTVVVGGILASLLLTGLSLAAVAIFTGGNGVGPRPGAGCSVPALSGVVVNVALTNMGASMMRGGMRLGADQTTVGHGKVSFLASNRGSLDHELVILPLSDTEIVGTRVQGGDAKIDEAASLGEASKTCGEGAGQGILPGSSGWVTVTLAPGRYELVCNLPGHYAAGMYTLLTVT